MNLFKAPQLSEEWWDLKVGKISGTRFGQVISTRENRLVYELMNEILTGQCDMSIFVTDDMQYGIDNEDVALKLYEEQSGIKVEKVGAIISDLTRDHIASPDGINIQGGIVQEVKCTQNGHTHLERYFEGIDSKHFSQCANYFAVSDEVQEVHYISYCGYRKERPMFYHVLKREDCQKLIDKGRKMIPEIMKEVKDKIEKYKF